MKLSIAVSTLFALPTTVSIRVPQCCVKYELHYYYHTPYCVQYETCPRDCNTIKRMLRSNSAAVDYNSSTGTVPRAEVVTAINDALEGDEAFVAIDHSDDSKNVVVLKLTSDGASLPVDTTGAFQLSGPFVLDEPDVLYVVDCPEMSATAAAVCTVVVNATAMECGGFGPYGGGNSDAVLKEKCGNVEYKVGLKSTNQDSGVPHFVLLGTLEGDLNGKTISECPNIIMLESDSGQKMMYSIDSFVVGADEDIHPLGSVTLGALIEAKNKAKAILEDEYNVFTNNCVHYAQTIWRDLEFDETEELAGFLVEQTMAKPGFRGLVEKQMANSGRIGDGLTRNPIDSDENLKAYLVESVYSQLDLA